MVIVHTEAQSTGIKVMENTRNNELKQTEYDEFFAEMYDETVNLVYSIVYKITNSQNDVDDIVQDVYAHAFARIDTLEALTLENFRPWVATIARNCAIDTLKKTRDISVESIEMLQSESLDSVNQSRFEHPDKLARLQERNALLYDAIQELPNDQQLCIVLFYFEDLSIKEIGEELNLNRNTVKSNLRYGKKKLAQILHEKTKDGTRVLGVFPIFSSYLLIRMLYQEGSSQRLKQRIVWGIGIGMVIVGATQLFSNVTSVPINPSVSEVADRRADELFACLDVSFAGHSGNGRVYAVPGTCFDSEGVENQIHITPNTQLRNHAFVEITITYQNDVSASVSATRKYLVNGLE